MSIVKKSLKLWQLLVALVIVLSSPVAADDKREQGDQYLSISSGPLKLSVDPTLGGRFASFTLDGKEALRVERDANNWHWGSTLWTSPQEDWGWPPIDTFDKDAFEVVAHGQRNIKLASRVDPRTRLQMFKEARFENDPGELPQLRMTYQVVNQGDRSCAVALWENIRVDWSGQVEFPSGGTFRFRDNSRGAVTEKVGATLRIPFNQKQPNAQKVFYTPPSPRDGILWSRYRNNGLVLTTTRKMPDRVAPNQAAIEIYLAPDSRFAEVENQGSFVELDPGQDLKMFVTWKLEPDKQTD